MIRLPLEKRLCECCGGDDLDAVWSNTGVVKKATSSYLFEVHIVVCRKCGFCFASPGPQQEALKCYYADGLPRYKGIGLAYSIEKRLSVLERYSVPAGVFAEIGGDWPEECHARCTGLFGTILNVEVAKGAHSEYGSVDELPSGVADVIAHYDVLEHIPNVRDFLCSCRRALKEGGIMVCEVPDVRLYPRNLLLLEFSHVNHFSVTTLAAIAKACGFRLVEVAHLCSRPFGFVSVFCKDSSQTDMASDLPFEYLDALSCVRGGINQVQGVIGHIKSLQGRITELGNQGEKITLWGVTELLRRLLENFILPETAIVVDSDPRRKTHLEDEGVLVFQPKECLAHINDSSLLVIFAPRYRAEILEWVRRETGKSFNPNDIEVVGAGPSGESLM